ncbi:AraC family transcriptional regulator [Pedobacter sp. L105]|uniref:helix-turn-helix domain-containing protein n=1 Tax=Pedobacter sp. L105 TaxID=1641871 RepID=UPI00131E11E3|nr:AraC family transcriptional regulator [Pedobacter sp. L105]
MMKAAISDSIIYNSHSSRYTKGEQFIHQHLLSYVVSGSLTVNDGRKDHLFQTGDFFFLQRDQLVKFDQLPPKEGIFASVTVYLDQLTLKNISLAYNMALEKTANVAKIVRIESASLLRNYVDAILDGLEIPDPNLEKEVVFMLLTAKPELARVLFDFGVPGKTDLKAFMLQNYHFNVSMDRFAYLTGRNLSTFKRDFEYIFHISPERWIQFQRLKEAYYQIKEKGKTPEEIYQQVGFDSINYFSNSFKRLFGVNPSSL